LRAKFCSKEIYKEARRLVKRNILIEELVLVCDLFVEVNDDAGVRGAGPVSDLSDDGIFLRSDRASFVCGKDLIDAIEKGRKY
jgi:hypothetical protein